MNRPSVLTFSANVWQRMTPEAGSIRWNRSGPASSHAPRLCRDRIVPSSRKKLASDQYAGGIHCRMETDLRAGGLIRVEEGLADGRCAGRLYPDPPVFDRPLGFAQRQIAAARSGIDLPLAGLRAVAFVAIPRPVSVPWLPTNMLGLGFRTDPFGLIAVTRPPLGGTFVIA